jgi:hypothetical protein
MEDYREKDNNICHSLGFQASNFIILDIKQVNITIAFIHNKEMQNFHNNEVFNIVINLAVIS